MVQIARLLLLIAPIVLTSCASFSRPSIIQGRDQHYLSARTVPTLRVPPNAKTMAFHEYYPIPNRSYPESAKTVSLIPPGLTV